MSLRNTFRKIPLVVVAYHTASRLLQGIRGSFRFIRQLALFYWRQGRRDRFVFTWTSLSPCLTDATAATPFNRHYTFHTAWAARILAANKPSLHHDISSAIYFSTLVSAFIPVKFYDLRPARLNLSNLSSEKGDLTALPFTDQSVTSLSCMHVVEHIGLGRYGDPLDPEGDLKAIAELQRVVARGGHMLFVVPVGSVPRLMFNAHRIYSPDMILSLFKERFDLRQFVLIPENPKEGDLVESPSPDLLQKQYYACGCFWFQKKPLV